LRGDPLLSPLTPTNPRIRNSKQGIDFEKFNYDVLDIDSPGGGGQLDPSYYE
jgi:hypothetical protein